MIFYQLSAHCIYAILW